MLLPALQPASCEDAVRSQLQVVSQLEVQLQRERERLSALMDLVQKQRPESGALSSSGGRRRALEASRRSAYKIRALELDSGAIISVNFVEDVGRRFFLQISLRTASSIA